MTNDFIGKEEILNLLSSHLVLRRDEKGEVVAYNFIPVIDFVHQLLAKERERLIETIEKEMPMGQELATSIPLENRSNPIGFLCEQREKVGFNSYRAEVLKILEALKSQK